MKRVFGVMLALLLGGCSGGVYTPLVEAEVDLAAPILGLNDDIEVVYPYQERNGSRGNVMVETYGPSWRDLHSEYPEYRFNP